MICTLLQGEFGPRLCAFQPFLLTLLTREGIAAGPRGEFQTLTTLTTLEDISFIKMTKTFLRRFSRDGARSMCAWHLELGEKAGIGNALVPALLHPGPSAALLTLSGLRHYLEVTEDENGTRELISLAQFSSSTLTLHRLRRTH